MVKASLYITDGEIAGQFNCLLPEMPTVKYLADIENRKRIIFAANTEFDLAFAEEHCEIRNMAGKHICKYCGGLAESEYEDLLCSNCRELFGHSLYSDFKGQTELTPWHHATGFFFLLVTINAIIFGKSIARFRKPS